MTMSRHRTPVTRKVVVLSVMAAVLAATGVATGVSAAVQLAAADGGSEPSKSIPFERVPRSASPSPTFTIPKPIVSAVRPPSPTAETPTTPTAKPKRTTTTKAIECHKDAEATITDYVAEHTQTMSRATCNTDIAIYFDPDAKKLPADRTAWVTSFATDLWKYMKKAYGKCVVDRGPGCDGFGAPKPALFFLHGDQVHGGTVSTRLDQRSGFRTTIDVGNGEWRQDDDQLRDTLVHEACHHIELASQGTQNSPAFPLWGDSKWAEFCVYDFYASTGRTSDADRVESIFLDGKDDLPPGAHDTAWFKDWFLPLWHDGGDGPEAMNRYFGLLAEHFPTNPHSDGHSRVYQRDLTLGEYVLFTGAAAGHDLSDRAEETFGRAFDRRSYERAKRDFPQLDI
jgi:hypothetical protein